MANHHLDYKLYKPSNTSHIGEKYKSNVAKTSRIGDAYRPTHHTVAIHTDELLTKHHVERTNIYADKLLWNYSVYQKNLYM